MYWIIDRYEDAYAVLENTVTQETKSYPRKNLPQNAKPGDTLIRRDDGWEVDLNETAVRAKKIKDRFALLKRMNGY